MDEQSASLQDGYYAEGCDYAKGAPHLTNSDVSSLIVGYLAVVARATMAARGGCRVLDLGAGHGSFTDEFLVRGATVTASEMSAASARYLADRYKYNSRVSVVHDASGEEILSSTDTFDVVSCISVLHHVPDYLRLIEGLTSIVATQGSFVCFEDPLLYSNVRPAVHTMSQLGYYLWRIGQGDYLAGAASFVRRARKEYDLTEPRDMVEYHVLRGGVDEDAIGELLGRHFESVELVRYWAVQSRVVHALGKRLRYANKFGFVARGRK